MTQILGKKWDYSKNFWVPSFSCCISMTFHLQYPIAMWIFTPMTLHYGWLILILCISNTDFRKSQQSKSMVLAKQDGLKRKKKQNSYLLEPSKHFPTAQTHRLTFRCKALKSKLGVKIEKHLNWNSHIDYMITKLNSTVNLLKRTRKYLNLSLRNLPYNALIKPIFEYCCCSVWGNAKIDNLWLIINGLHCNMIDNLWTSGFSTDWN